MKPLDDKNANKKLQGRSSTLRDHAGAANSINKVPSSSSLDLPLFGTITPSGKTNEKISALFGGVRLIAGVVLPLMVFKRYSGSTWLTKYATEIFGPLE